MNAEHHSDAGADRLRDIRNSLARALGQAVLELRPGSTPGSAQAVEDGFHHDFVLSAPLSEDDFADIERIMGRIVAGTHTDVPNNAFKLRNLSGAYRNGDSDDVMMTRISAWAFADREALDAHLQAYLEAQARDHKKLGRELDIYHVDELVGRGLPMWLPNGTVVRDELEKLARELEFKGGYQRVATPHLARTDLYHMSGHLPYYQEDMFPGMAVHEVDSAGSRDETYLLRPMNCPHHHRVFAARPRSYRELPLRLAEYGQCYRWESSGAVSGLLRVRGFCMNDAHIYCAPEQVKDELKQVMALYRQVYRILGLSDYRVRLSRWDPQHRDKYVDDPAAWTYCECVLAEVLTELDIDYADGPDEAAFYGPKVDIQFRTVTGREESVSTVQLDFAQPARMGLRYVAADGTPQVPYCIHRAPLSTHERMVAILLEHYAGAFPTWLAPVQVRVLTVSDAFDDYAGEIVARLRERLIRAELSRHGDTVAKKVREGIADKVPNLLVVGDRERRDRTVTLRRYGVERQATLPLEAFERQIVEAVAQRLPALEVS